MKYQAWWEKLHWPEYAAELLGTAFLLFVGLSAIIFGFDTNSPLARVLPDSNARRLITGMIFAGSGPLVAISPLGKLSGGHLNPAVSLAFWIQGKMHRHDLVGYIVSQFIGAVLGAALLVLIWRERAFSIKNGVTAPGVGYPLWSVFLLEMGLTFLLVFCIFCFVSNGRLMRWTPLMTWILFSTMVWLEAPISGTSLNPARSFGPALISWFWRDQWLYFLAPLCGALLGVAVCRLFSVDVLTAKLYHVPHYRCIFKNIRAPHMQAEERLKSREDVGSTY